MIFSERGVNELLEKGGEPPSIQASRTLIHANRRAKTMVLERFLIKKLPKIRLKTASSQGLFQQGLREDSQILDSL
jgi:hypothetical protein